MNDSTPSKRVRRRLPWAWCDGLRRRIHFGIQMHAGEDDMRRAIPARAAGADSPYMFNNAIREFTTARSGSLPEQGVRR